MGRHKKFLYSQIRKIRESTLSLRELAKIYGVSICTLSRIRSGKGAYRKNSKGEKEPKNDVEESSSGMPGPSMRDDDAGDEDGNGEAKGTT